MPLISAFVWPRFQPAFTHSPLDLRPLRLASRPQLSGPAPPESIKGVQVKWERDEETTKFAEELKRSVPEKVVNGFGLEKVSISTLPDWCRYKEESPLALVSRACTRDLYDEVLRQMGVEHIPLPCTSSEDPPVLLDPPIRRAAVVGNAGIGKSVGLLHALRRLLRAGKVAVFHYAKTGKAYAFVPSRVDAGVILSESCREDLDLDGGSEVEGMESYTVYRGMMCGVRESDVSSVEPICNHPEVFYLLDPNEDGGFPILLANTIVATTPYEKKLKDYWKEDYYGEYYMPMYTLDESMRSLQNDTLGYLNETVVRERFHVVGGDIRAIMRPTVFNITRSLISHQIIRAEDPTWAICCLRNESAGMDEYSTCNPNLYRYESQYPFKEAHIDFMSEFARVMMCNKFGKELRKEGFKVNGTYRDYVSWLREK